MMRAVAALMVFVGFGGLVGFGGAARAASFDVVPIAAAEIRSDDGRADGLHRVAFPVEVSIVPHTAETMPIDRVVIRVRPRGSIGRIVDFDPRTRTDTEVEGPVLEKRTEEASHSGGLSLDALYGGIGKAHAGMDRGGSRVQTFETKRRPTLIAAVAAGTYDGGRGVLFKLDAGSQHLIEGMRVFTLTMEVPASWRGEMVDVQIDAYGTRPKRHWFDTADDIHRTVRRTVAVYRGDDAAARRDAEAVLRAERRLRTGVRRAASTGSHTYQSRRIAASDKLGRHANDHHANDHRVSDQAGHGRRGGLESVAAVFAPISSLAGIASSPSSSFPGDDRGGKHARWIDDVVHRGADVHHDDRIAAQPVGHRVLALDYVDATRRLTRDR